jgi:hypothetical protein
VAICEQAERNEAPTGKRFEEGIVQGFEITKILYKTRVKNIFESKLRALCIAYDNENGAYPESDYEGLSLFEFFMEEGVGEIPEFNGEFLKDRWNSVLDGWKAGRLGCSE